MTTHDHHHQQQQSGDASDGGEDDPSDYDATPPPLSPQARQFADHLRAIRSLSHEAAAQLLRSQAGADAGVERQARVWRVGQETERHATRICELLYAFLSEALTDADHRAPSPQFHTWLDEADACIASLRSLGASEGMPAPFTQILGAVRRHARQAAAMLGIALGRGQPLTGGPLMDATPGEEDIARAPTARLPLRSQPDLNERAARLTPDDAAQASAALRAIGGGGVSPGSHDVPHEPAQEPLAPLWLPEWEAGKRLSVTEEREQLRWLDTLVRVNIGARAGDLGTVIQLAMRADGPLLHVLFHSASDGGAPIDAWYAPQYVLKAGATNTAARFWRERAERERHDTQQNHRLLRRLAALLAEGGYSESSESTSSL